MKDITGLRSGKLVAIKPTDKRSSNQGIIWLCQCDCGNISYVPARKIISKSIQSCGCSRKNYKPVNKIDLLNQRFGLLTVIEDIGERDNYGQAIWLCKCDCGNLTKVRSKDLRSGNTRSCGCQRNNSYGESKIVSILKNANINFIREKTFDSCRFIKTNTSARFDFYLPDYNTLIEYDGVQHFIQGKGYFDNEEKFYKTQMNDIYKTKWCHDNNITLIRIPYTAYDSLSLDDLLPNSSSYIN